VLVEPQSSPLRTEPPSRQPESLSGLIERVTFFNDENGWAVLKVKTKGRRDLVTLVGSLPSVSAGEWVTADRIPTLLMLCNGPESLSVA
jgi:hypothetical protein